MGDSTLVSFVATATKQLTMATQYLKVWIFMYAMLVKWNQLLLDYNDSDPIC